ncbi:MAG: PaaI family thioesterase [Pseudomonadota bacterium]
MTDLINAMPFARGLGLTLLKAEPDAVEAEFEVVEALCTTGKILHGGAAMSVADTLGAIAAFANLPEGSRGTTTIESKTNFLRAAPLGTRVRATTTPVKVGRRLSVWQTTLRDANDKEIARVTQSQLVL